MGGKVRPFEHYVLVGASDKVLAHGQIENNRFVITIRLLQIEVETIEVSEDKYGPFAVLEEKIYPWRDKFELVVQREYDVPSWVVDELGNEEMLPPGPPGLEITLRELRDPRTIGDLEVKAVIDTGISPSEMNLLVPCKWGLSIYFNSIGKVDGAGMMTPIPENISTLLFPLQH